MAYLIAINYWPLNYDILFQSHENESSIQLSIENNTKVPPLTLFFKPGAFGCARLVS